MEIERRWLVNGWPEGIPAQIWHMDQGYFAVRPAVRIRREAEGEERWDDGQERGHHAVL